MKFLSICTASSSFSLGFGLANLESFNTASIPHSSRKNSKNSLPK
ncbi:MAG: hypothetical protein ABJQ29_08460 [Luteolibacter sp.]